MNKNNTAAKAATVATTREAQILQRVAAICKASDRNPIGSPLTQRAICEDKKDVDVVRILVKKGYMLKVLDGGFAMTELGATAAGIEVKNVAATTYEDAMKAPVQPSKAKLPKVKKEKADGESKLDWAYRRLRRTTFDFIVRKVKLNDDDRKALREELERVRHDYGSLRTAVESMNAAWNIDFEEILEEFFGHVIHPGSGNHGVRKAD